MSEQKAEAGGEVAGCVGFLIAIATVVAAMFWIENTFGFSGVLSIVGSLVVSLILGFIVFAVYCLIFVRPPVSQDPTAAVSSKTRTPPQRSESASPVADALVSSIRQYDRDLARSLKAFHKAAAERPDFSPDLHHSIHDKVQEMHAHHEAYSHILDDEAHPDNAIVTREMQHYRTAIDNLLQLRTQDLQSGKYGGFDYRESLRKVEGDVELLSDEFGKLFEQLESEEDRRRDPEATL